MASHRKVGSKELHREESMRQRGRKSAAGLSIVPVAADQRPQPPARLSAAERRVWRDTVERLPAHWFRGSEPVLESYCVAVDLSRFLSEQVKAAAPGDKRFADLVKLLRAEAALVARLAGTLRLTPRSTWSRTPHLISSMKPWEIGQLGHADGAPESEGRTFDEIIAQANRDDTEPPDVA
jgi:hypothetical protein